MQSTKIYECDISRLKNCFIATRLSQLKDYKIGPTNL